MSTLTLGGATLANKTGSVVSINDGVVLPVGSVLQVLQTIKTDKEQIAGSQTKDDYSLVPGQGGTGVFQQSITTTGSNKVLVYLILNQSHKVTGYTFQGAIFRGSATDTAIGSCTKLGIGTEAQSGQNSASFIKDKQGDNAVYNNIVMFLDSPGAGTHFYKAGAFYEYHTSTNYGYINRSASDLDQVYSASVMSQITLMEVKV